MDLGVIKFPYEFKSEFLSMSKIDEYDNETLEKYQLSEKEITALVNIDMMKTETAAIYKYENAEKTTKSYALSKDKERILHDDRFYTLIMLAHRLHELRRGQTLQSANQNNNYDFSSAPICASAISY